MSVSQCSNDVHEMRLQRRLHAGMVFCAPSGLAMKASEGGEDSQTSMSVRLWKVSAER